MTGRLALAKPAVRVGQKARIALTGPSGAGKTWTALTIAQELAGDGRILLVDTEEGSGALYANRFNYEHLQWAPPYDPRELTATLAQARGYSVVIVDSLSHFWDDEGGTLDIVDSVAARHTSKNSFAAWKEGTPIQKDMVRGMLRCPAHVIVTMRAKTEYVLEQITDKNGRTVNVPKRVGLAPVQRAGLEYEFTVLGMLELNHQLVIDKSRCDLVADKRYLAGKAGDFARVFAGWLSTAEPEPEPPALADEATKGLIQQEIQRHKGERFGAVKAVLEAHGITPVPGWGNTLTQPQADALLGDLVQLTEGAVEPNGATPEPEAVTA
jgi:hypothetical protein